MTLLTLLASQQQQEIKRLGLDIPLEIYRKIEQHCERLHISKTEFVRRSITLMLAVLDRSSDHKVGLAFFNKDDNTVTQEIVMF